MWQTAIVTGHHPQFWFMKLGIPLFGMFYSPQSWLFDGMVYGFGFPTGVLET